ncbi:MAG: glycoside hydrolase family 31 protein [Verrucomicrobiota bacterium]|nr:glycoside hydrolase family 31 protein [Verrucomicrobiota bacterium]
MKKSRFHFRLGVAPPDIFHLHVSQKKTPERSWSIEEPLSFTKRSENRVASSEAECSFNPETGEVTIRDKYGYQLLQSTGSHCSLFPRPKLIFKIAAGEEFFGLGETTGPMNKRGLKRVLWNIDVLGHSPGIHPSLQSLYVSIPFLISVREGRAFGIFWDNPARQTWDVGNGKSDELCIEADSGEISLYFFVGPSVRQILESFTKLTGRIPLPPQWALGYQQSRYSYESRDQLESIAEGFRSRKIPCDVLHLDIHHMDEYRVFTFGKKFPNPQEMISGLHRKGFKIVSIVDPGVKNDFRFPLLNRGRKAGMFVRGPTGKPYIGKVWPGRSLFPDFTSARVRRWWGKEQQVLFQTGVAGIWNDMNEPANFALPTKTLPEKCIHRSDFGKRSHAELHNIYGMQMARASQEGALNACPGRRPFVISRAGYAGIQKHALIWTGDNSSHWEHLGDSIQQLLNLGLSGVPFCGSDAGGFLENCSGELLIRWIQMAAFTPFFRNHSNIKTCPQEPWAFGEETERICRNFIKLRYRLLPYLYSTFQEAHSTGAPIMRPLFWHYQNDPRCREVDDQFFLGANILVAPILRSGARARSVYLPAGIWHNFWNGEKFRGGRDVLAQAPLDRIPIFIKAGSIIPLIPVQQSIESITADNMLLHVWPGHYGEFEWYEDDGVSLGYASGKFLKRKISLKAREGGGELQYSSIQGEFQSQVKNWTIVIHDIKQSRVMGRNKEIESFRDRNSQTLVFGLENEPGALQVSWCRSR